jgi:hypothetical protein
MSRYGPKLLLPSGTSGHAIENSKLAGRLKSQTKDLCLLGCPSGLSRLHLKPRVGALSELSEIVWDQKSNLGMSGVAHFETYGRRKEYTELPGAERASETKSDSLRVHARKIAQASVHGSHAAIMTRTGEGSTTRHCQRY